MEIKNKGAVVTGSGSGIGRGIALALAGEGASGIIVADIEIQRARSVADEIQALGVKAEPFHIDVRDEAQWDSLAEFAWQELGSVSLLFNNAGVAPHGSAFDATADDVRWVFEVNVFGLITGCRVFGTRFLAASDRAWICNTGSRNSVGIPVGKIGSYVATKHAVLGYTDALRREYGERIGFSVLCPGTVATETWNSGRNRPAERGGSYKGDPALKNFVQELGLDPLLVGRLTVEGVKNEEFFIWTHPWDIELVDQRQAEARSAVERQWPNGPLPEHKRSSL